jgi:hypothetical protein
VDVLGAIEQWQDFFLALAGAAAVLLGLTFIGASIHLERGVRATWYRDLAISSGTCLFYAMIIALMMLIPDGRPGVQAVLLLLVSGFGAQSARAAYIAARQRHPSRQALIFRFGLPWASMAVLAIAGIGLALSWAPAVWLVAGVALINVVFGTQNAWDLMQRAAVSDEDAAAPDAGSTSMDEG